MLLWYYYLVVLLIHQQENHFQNQLLFVSTDVLYQLEKIGVLGGVFFRNNSQYLPMSYLGINYKNHTKIIYGTKLYYGGYNHLQLGINAIYNSKKIKGEIDFQNFFSLIPSLGTSFGLLLKLSWKIT